jgi:hypothetical protein
MANGTSIAKTQNRYVNWALTLPRRRSGPFDAQTSSIHSLLVRPASKITYHPFTVDKSNHSILLLLGCNSFALHTSRGRANICLDTKDLLLADNAVCDLFHTLEVFPVANLLIEELIKIKTKHLSFFTDTQMHARNVLEDEQQDARNDEGVSRDRSDLGELLANLHAVAVDTTRSRGGTIESANLLVGKNTGEERAHHSADTVKLEDVKAFVDVQPVVEVLERSADDCCEKSDDGCEPDRYVASGGCDADQASDSTFAGTNNGEFSLCADVVDNDPADGTCRSGDVGVEGGVPIRHVSYRSDVVPRRALLTLHERWH